MYWFIQALTKYAVFSGRARRKEFWYFALFNTIISIVLVLIDFESGNLDPETGLGLLQGIYMLAILLPLISVSVRRLHDTGRSGWWFLVSFVPVVGHFVMLLFMVQKGQPDSNQYGLDPKMETPEDL
jgi:uncharacterized membrane protein YhaH (DUF805 family)